MKTAQRGGMGQGKDERRQSPSRNEELRNLVPERWERLIAYGTQVYPRETQRRLRILNMFSYLIAFVTFTYAVQLMFVNWKGFLPVIAINFALVVVALVVPFMHRIHETAGGILIAVSEYVGLYLLTMFLGRDSGLQLQFLIGAAAPFVIFGLGRLTLILTISIAGALLHIVCWFQFSRGTALLKVDEPTLAGIYLGAAMSTAVLIAATVYYAFRLAADAQSQTDRVLRTILPETIAERLMQEPDQTISDAAAEATVMFADIVGFTPLSKRLGPEKTVELLSEIFDQIDQLIAVHEVEKIKTIGDAYMIVAGVPEAQDDHCERLINLALALPDKMDDISRRLGVDVGVRIGVNTGPVMAGVIGRNRYTYDVWGDTVNLAARLETYGKPGRVHISQAVVDRLGDRFHYYDRGERSIKGVGRMRTFYVFDPATMNSN